MIEISSLFAVIFSVQFAVADTRYAYRYCCCGRQVVNKQQQQQQFIVVVVHPDRDARTR